jgi:hypothetical protein
MKLMNHKMKMNPMMIMMDLQMNGKENELKLILLQDLIN